jgi:hypothetical protein
MLMLLFGVLWLIGAVFVTICVYAMVTTHILTPVILIALLGLIWFLSGLGGKPTHFLPRVPEGEPPRKWGSNHIGHPAGQNSLDHPDMW